jgi:hypothetical protein
MNKFLLLLLPFLLFADEQRLLISGFTIHEKPNNRFDEPYNAVNYGLGYEYNFYKEPKQLYFGMNALILKDSFYNPQFSIGVGHYMRFDMGALQSAVGLSGFIGWKRIYDDNDLDRDGGKYSLAGGIAPALNFYYKNAGVNFMYVPSFHYRDIDITGFFYTYFSWKF